MIKAVDCHCHTWNSPDSDSNPEEICRMAREFGLLGIAFTDHCDANRLSENDAVAVVQKSVKDAELMQSRYGERLEVLRGVELGNHAFNPELVRRVLRACEFDIVVGSVHAVAYNGIDKNISKIDFGSFSEQEVREYLALYFKETLRVVESEDINSIAHITFGVRYMIRREPREIDITPYLDTVELALSEMIKRSVALEINANDVVPRMATVGRTVLRRNGVLGEISIGDIDFEIARRYYEMGGRIITLGSDGHAPERVGRAFDEIIPKLRDIGFEQAYYFKNRSPVAYKL